MAIRIQQADVSDFARMGLLAGESIAAVREEGQEFQRGLQTQAEKAAADRQMTGIVAAKEQQQIGIEAARTQQEIAGESQRLAIALQDQAARTRQRLALANQREMQEFDASMATQSQQRSMAWELEKIEVSARNRFELEEQAYAMEFRTGEANKIRITQETQQKIAAINKARGDIGERTADALILSLETGIPQIASEATRARDPAKEAVARMMEATAPQQKEIFEATNRLFQLRAGQDPETQREIDQILEGKNLQTMRRAIETLGGEGIKPVSPSLTVSTDTNFLKGRISSGQHTANTNNVMKEAISRGNPRELTAVAAAVRSIEEDQRRAAARASEVAANQELARQRELERGVRERLGTQTVIEKMGKIAETIPRPMFF